MISYNLDVRRPLAIYFPNSSIKETKRDRQKQQNPHYAGFVRWCVDGHRLLEAGLWCGDRRTVVGSEGSVLVGLEFGRFFDVPQRLSIKKSAIYGFRWNRIGNFWAV